MKKLYPLKFERDLIEQFLHKHTGIEFVGGKYGNYGFICTNPKRYNSWVKKQKRD